VPPKSCEQDPRRQPKPLEEVPPPLLNSPRRSELTPLTRANTDSDSVASGKATSALAAMLEAKRASRSMPDSGSLGGRDSDAENHPQLRRKRTLGRAASTGSESMLRGENVSGSRAEPAEEPQPGPAKEAAAPSDDSMLLSQKLIYEDPEMRQRREKLLAEIGGAKDAELEIAAAAVPAKRRGGRSRAKRR
jgi:hypothetical protein